MFNRLKKSKSAQQALIKWARISVILICLLMAWWAITLENKNCVIGYSSLASWFTTALKAVGPELAGIAIGIVVIDIFNEYRHKMELKEQLILQLGSKSYAVAELACSRLRSNGWITDGSLENKVFGGGANLKKAELAHAKLSDSSLTFACLEEADLTGAYLENADLTGANLKGANLQGAHLNGANLSGAQFQLAVLRDADLTGVTTRDVPSSASQGGPTNFEEALLKDAIFDKGNFAVSYACFGPLSDQSLKEELTRWKSQREWDFETPPISSPIDQLREAKSLAGAVMPDGTILKDTRSTANPNDTNPTFEEWQVMVESNSFGDEEE